MFPELKSLLDEGFHQAEPGEFVITRYRDSSQNLRTTFAKIIKRAGLKPWPKLFQNMRSSRETELTAEYAIHIVTAWLGNTPKVALMHYLQVTDEHFEKATQIPTQQPAASLR
jgi:hypothetical protein